MKSFFVNLVTIVCILLSYTSYGQKLQPLNFIKLSGDIIEAEDISGIAKIGPFLVIGSDESDNEDKNYIQLLNKETSERYAVHSNILLFKGNKKDGKEMDIEGLAAEGNNLYVVGSHASRHKKISRDENYNKNRKTFYDNEIKDERNRDWLYRLTIDSQGKEVSRERISLQKIIEDNAVLKTFKNIPSKENGIDIEGIAAKDGWLYVGFRGPVFRGNYIPVMKLKFDDPKNTSELLYINLDGHGIRGMASVSDGFLVVTGPVGDGAASYQLYHWDGNDVIPGKDREMVNIGKTRLLGEIYPPKKGKAEGVLVTQEGDTFYHFIIIYDGVRNKNNIMQRFYLAKP